MEKRDWIVRKDGLILVTGGGGFIGIRVVKTLIEFGFTRIRCLLRSPGGLERLEERVGVRRDCIEVVEGNLLVREDCRRAARGVRVIYHLAAGVDKSFAECFLNSVVATRNLLDAALEGRTLKRFVNVSSFAVYSGRKSRRGSVLDETGPLEDDPVARNDAYGYGKLKQEQMVAEYRKSFGVPAVTLRPGAVFGPGRPKLSGRIGVGTFGTFLHLGGRNRIPFTYVDNCAAAIALAGFVEGIEGEVFNIVDDDPPRSRTFLKKYKESSGGFRSIRVPYPLAYTLCFLWEKYSRWSEGQLPPVFNRRRCSAEWKRRRYSNEKLKRMTGWRPGVPFETALELYFQYIRRENGC